LGRWLSRDPVEEYGGVNLYSFLSNEPLTYVDDTGHGPFPKYRKDPKGYLWPCPRYEPFPPGGYVNHLPYLPPAAAPGTPAVSPAEGAALILEFDVWLLDQAQYKLLVARGITHCKSLLTNRAPSASCARCCVIPIYLLTDIYCGSTRWAGGESFLMDISCSAARAQYLKALSEPSVSEDHRHYRRTPFLKRLFNPKLPEEEPVETQQSRWRFLDIVGTFIYQ
ncbi:MAG: hypothetical protein J7M29_05085, partial [Verrucomicrobia bacterium]|nr:hypothetical protein [Verrucomicrobiota bacterium]